MNGGTRIAFSFDGLHFLASAIRMGGLEFMQYFKKIRKEGKILMVLVEFFGKGVILCHDFYNILFSISSIHD